MSLKVPGVRPVSALLRQALLLGSILMPIASTACAQAADPTPPAAEAGDDTLDVVAVVVSRQFIHRSGICVC